MWHRLPPLKRVQQPAQRLRISGCWPQVSNGLLELHAHKAGEGS